MSILDEFYSLLYQGKDIRKLHIPKSDVFYAKAAYEAYTGNSVSLEEMEDAMLAEGMIDLDDTRHFKGD